MIAKIDSLKRSRDSFLKAIPPDGGINFWTEYLLAAVRSSGVSLRALDSSVKKIQIGDLQAVYFKIDVTGDYDSVYRLVSTIEDGQWYARVLRMRVKKKLEGVESSLQVAVLFAKEQP